jgi:2-haloacid dehalogenase
MRKPDPGIYVLTCARLAVEPTDSVFVDDNADNVEAARAYGMEAVHFQENPWDAIGALDAILERRGLMTS